MKLTNIKARYLFPGLVLLLLLLILPIRHFIINVGASGEVYQLRILEITDSGTTELANLKSGMSNVTIDTMSMKRFVSLRDDLDGRYDAVYIGKGSYNKNGVTSKSSDATNVRAAAHDTTAVMNDITLLKAKELTDYFINKGLYVIFNKDPFVNQKSDQRGILYNTFNTYRKATPKENVFFVNDTELTDMITSITKGENTYLTGLKQRPRLHITNKNSIIDYSANQDHIYKPGDTLNFKFNVANVTDFQSHPILAKLYVSVDKSVKTTESQVVAITTLNQNSTGEINYKLPNTFSGLMYWKLEISDHLNSNKLKDFDSGTIRFRGKKTIVNILQVLPNSGTERTSSLTNSNNMKESYLSTDDYELNIQTKTITEFNTYVAAKYKVDKTYGLNGVYDMLIFGFRDVYNSKAPITDLTTEAILNFANVTKQSVMFTHDTVYSSSSNWVKYFMETTGQVKPETNLGLSAPNTSKLVKPVNDGLLTQYPFYLSTLDDNNEQKSLITPQVATTHNQYFTLNLEDPTIIPWYNIVGNKRDTNDSWNHYYTYSKGNVTYSGTGHIFGTSTTEKFPDWEQKLFVNTMYRAYIGANHSPEIKVNTPQQNEIKPSYQQELLIDYTVEDSDLSDRDLFTTIRFKSDGAYLEDTGFTEAAVISGETVHQTFLNPLPEGGELTIEITAHDKQGAYATPQVINITILKASANIEVSRELSANVNTNGEVGKDEKFTITYIIKPKSVPFDQVSIGDQLSENQIISDIKFHESLPANIEYTEDWPAGIIPSGNVQTGYTLEKSLGDIHYSLETENGVKTFVPDSSEPYKFSIDVKATTAQTFNFNTAYVDFMDIHDANTVSATPSPSPTASAISFDPSESASASALGLAGDYNAFVFGSATVTASLKGNLAAGGNTITSGVDINKSYGNTVPYALITGGDLNFTNGRIHGNVLHQGSFTKVDSGTIEDGTYSRGTLIDFEVARKYYENYSDQLGAFPANGTSKLEYGNLYLSGTQETNVFHFASDTFQAGWPKITVPNNSSMIYNVVGKTIDFSKAFPLPNGTTGNNVIFNFPNATTVNISSVEINGSILAPRAAVNISNGRVLGNVIAASLNASSLIDILPYAKALPVPLPTASPVSTPAPTPTPSPVPRISIPFTAMTITALDRLTSIIVMDTEVLLGDSQMLSKIILPVEKANDPLNWSSNNPAFVSVSPLGVVTAHKVGSAEITAATTDGRIKSAPATVTVKIPTLDISGHDSALVNEPINLTANYRLSKESDIRYTWHAIDENGLTLITTNETDPHKAVFTAKKTGKYTVTVTVNTISVSKTITVGLNSLKINGINKVVPGGSITLNVTTDPIGADHEQFKWTLIEASDLSSAGFINDSDALPKYNLDTTKKSVTLKGISPNKAIEITVSAGGILSDTFVVSVLEPGLAFNPFESTLLTGESLSLLQFLYTTNPYGDVPPTIISRLIWESDNTSVAVVDQSGNVTTIAKGIAHITTSYTRGPDDVPKAIYTLTVNNAEDATSNRY